MKELKEALRDHNLFMGYTNAYKAEDDPTSFFVYDDSEIDQAEKQFSADRYQVHNANTLAGVGKKNGVMKSFTFKPEEAKIFQDEPIDPMLLTIA